MGCIIKIEDENGKVVSYFRFKNSERCTSLYNHLIADNYLKARRLTIKLLSDEAKVVSICYP